MPYRAENLATFLAIRAAPWRDPAWWALAIGAVGLVWQFMLPASLGAILFLLCWILYVGAVPAFSFRAMGSVIVPWLFPAWAALSLLWTQDKAITGRAAAELLVTVGVALVAARKLKMRDFVSALMLAECTGAAGSLISGKTAAVGLTNTTALIGIYASKNEQAQHDGVLLILAMAVIMDKNQPMAFRVLGLLGSLIGFAIVVEARSVATAAPLAAALSVEMFIILSRLMRPRSRAILYPGVAIITLLMLLVAWAAAPPFDQILESLGKNANLTGRTILWDRAAQYVAMRPIFGLGYYDFWVQSNAEPEGLWHIIKIISRAGLTFQNTFWHYAVELGLPGAFLIFYAILGTFSLVMMEALRRPSLYMACFFAYFLFTIQRTYLEVDFGFPFTLATIVLAGAWAYVRPAASIALTGTRQQRRRRPISEL